MGFSMFSAGTSPIAIDFGASSVKLLQVSDADRPQIVAAAELPISQALRNDPESLFPHFAGELPALLKSARFKGRRIVTAIPSGQTLVQHMQITPSDGVNRDDVITAQVESQMNCPPNSVLVRTFEVKDINRGGQQRTEMICFAVARQNVMRYIDLLKKCRLEVVGMHTEALSMTRSFEHLSQRESDNEVTTLFIDLGWGGTRVAITHGKTLVFARHIPIGGRHFDQLIASALHCDAQKAREHRIALQGDDALFRKLRADRESDTGNAILETAMTLSQSDPDAAAAAGSVVTTERRSGVAARELAHDVNAIPVSADQSPVDFSELLDTMTDELSMCLRYHRGLFPERSVDRAIFLGGEARQVWLCQHVVRQLGLPAQLGDPISRYRCDDSLKTPGLDRSTPQPGWAVACGLCVAGATD